VGDAIAREGVCITPPLNLFQRFVMPTYEYICSKCGHKFEKFQRISEAALKICPQELCPQKPWGKGKVKRVIGAGAGVIFKGSGFYATDYRSDKYKAAAKKDAPPSSAPPAASSDSSSKAAEGKSSGSGSSESSSKK
jgi:putative FmdB family regulatory protein